MHAYRNVPRDSRSLWLAATILGFWLLSLIYLLLFPISQHSWIVATLAILLRTFLQTGLFILGHDAMHQSLFRNNRSANDRAGRVALALYAGLPYRACRLKHLRHHLAPGQHNDPDFHDDQDSSLLSWYWHFMRGYLSPAQLIALLSCWLAAAVLLHPFLPWIVFNIACFWIVPLFLSSLQLFFFGTYLPHRHSLRSAANRHHAVSLAMPECLSLLACYHFGYHWEHHEYPHVPWHRLPAMRRPSEATLSQVPLALPDASR